MTSNMAQASNTVHAFLCMPVPRPEIRDSSKRSMPRPHKRKWAENLEFEESHVEDLSNFVSPTTFPRGDQTDHARLGQPFLATHVLGVCSNVADVTSYWNMHVRFAVQTAWAAHTDLRFHTGLRVPRQWSPDTPALTMDEIVQFETDDPHGLLLMGTDFRRPASLKPTQWAGQSPKSVLTTTIEQELVGYAYAFNLRIICCFDGLTLVILRWATAKREEVKTTSAACFVLAVDEAPMTVPWAYYIAIKDGYQRAVAGQIEQQ